MKRWIWIIVLLIAIVLWIIPFDPTDLLDFGTPLIETIVGIFALYKTIRG